jgi:hypothetical protein
VSDRSYDYKMRAGTTHREGGRRVRMHLQLQNEGRDDLRTGGGEGGDVSDCTCDYKARDDVQPRGGEGVMSDRS